MTAVQRKGAGMGTGGTTRPEGGPGEERRTGSGTMRRFEHAFADESPSTAARCLRAVIANAPVVFCAFDRAGTIRLSEGRGHSPLGFVPGEVVGRSAFDVFSSLQSVGVDGRATPLPEAIRLALSGQEVTGLCASGERV